MNIYIYMYVCIYISIYDMTLCVSMYVYICVCMYVRIYIYAHLWHDSFVSSLSATTRPFLSRSTVTHPDYTYKWVMSHTWMGYDAFMRGTWLIHTCKMTRVPWRVIRRTWLIHTTHLHMCNIRDMTQLWEIMQMSHVTYDWDMSHVTYNEYERYLSIRISLSHENESCHTWHDSFTYVENMRDMTHIVRNHAFIWGTWLIHMHSYVGHDSFTCVTWRLTWLVAEQLDRDSQTYNCHNCQMNRGQVMSHVITSKIWFSHVAQT